MPEPTFSPSDAEPFADLSDFTTESPSSHAGIVGLGANAPGQEALRQFVKLQRAVTRRGAMARFFGADPRSAESRPWYQGYQGELAVAAALARLGTQWTVLHAVPVGRGESDIDHIVVSPAGVFTVNTKRHWRQKIWLSSKLLMVGGQKTSHLRNARYEAQRASALLSERLGFPVPVRAVIAIVDSAEWTVRSRPEDVSVLRATELRRVLLRRRRVWSADEVALIREVAVQPSTWHAVGRPPLTVAEKGEFAVLRREVETARTIRRLWLLAAMGALAMVMLTSVLPAIFLAAG